jgi:tRNA-splicing endonuclease subunit Sen34
MLKAQDLPIPISLIHGHYLLFSVDVVTYLRQEHHICGVLVGTLPQIPQQNVFLGLPLELMPEEARLLVEKNVAYIVDDVRVHKEGMKDLSAQDRRQYMQDLEQQGLQASQLQAGRKEKQREEALKRLEQATNPESTNTAVQNGSEEGDNSLFAPEPSSVSALASPRTPITAIAPFGITPPISRPLFDKNSLSCRASPPEVPPSYPLFAHLHSRGYFLSPGLRFGCQYLAYPGDPLRFHSHFLVVAAEWDEEIDLMDLVVGGRLGTGVKKGFLIGGKETPSNGGVGNTSGSVRTFSIEWAGM